MKKLLWALAFLFLASAAFAQPNHESTVQQVYATGAYTLSTHDGQAAFVDAAVAALHQRDPRWGHLKKRPGQTNIHGHAEDAALYLSDTPGQSVAVDFIAGAGGPSPKPYWNPDQPRYSASDWLDPDQHGGSPVPTPTPTPQPPPVDLTPILKSIEDLSRQLNALSLEIKAATDAATAARLTAQSARDRIEDTLTAVDLARQQINRPPIYSGGLLGIPITLRPTVHPANPITPQ